MKAPYQSGEIVEIVYESFRYSQGDPDFHEELLGFVGNRHADRLQTFQIAGNDESIQLAEAVEKQLNIKLLRFISQGTAHRLIDQAYVDEHVPDMEDPEEYVQFQTAQSMGFLLDGVLGMTEFNVDRALDFVIDRDVDYLDPASKAGRPRSEGRQQRPSTTVPRHISQFVRHGLIGKATRLLEYDEFFDEVTAHLPDFISTEQPEYQLREHKLKIVVREHLRHRPQDVGRIQPEHRDLLVGRLGLKLA
jgi:hypothetical protein